MGQVDFVLLWVDGSDLAWLEEKKQYDPRVTDAASCAARYRDWDNLQYWFRGVEQFAPWVNRIFFVTWGHTPKWLNTAHPKLQIVKHTDFIPAQYLPTYNSNTIELNLHRIPELSEQFVLFNDDMFLIRPCEEWDFFEDGLPRDEFVLNAIVPSSAMPIIGHTNVNNTGIINQYFKKEEVFRKYRGKIYNSAYGKNLIRTVMLSRWSSFVGFRNPHLPLSHLKSTFSTLWELEPEKLDATCGNRFRQFNDLNHWLMRYWNLCSGKFIPRSSSFGKLFNASSDNQAAVDYIRNQKGHMVCINDGMETFDFDQAKAEMIEAMESILPEKSSFEL